MKTAVDHTILAEGGCLCGAVRYGVTSYPEFVVNCACNFCQRATGGHYLVETLYPPEDLILLAGVPRLRNHRSAGSGKIIHMRFCGDCGTQLYMGFERYDDCVGVFSGTFDDPNWFPHEPETTKYFYVEKMPDGVTIPAGYGAFYGHGLKLDGTDNTPQVFDAHTEVNAEIRDASYVFARGHGEA